MLTTRFIVAAVLVASPALAQPLTPAEKAAGWRVLFDGSSTSSFRGYKSDKFPAKGWAVEENSLRCTKGGGGGDIITTDQFEDFELSVEFKCSPGANSGIMYRVTEAGAATYSTGPEYQVLDDAAHKDAADPKHTCGSLYDMIAPSPPPDHPAAPAGQWNTARIRLSHGLLQHFLNGKKVVECRIDTPDWKEMIGRSKFKDMAGFGVQPRGHLAFQDHGDDVWYRNIRVRDLKATAPGEVALFNGKDMTGWTWFEPAGGKADATWSVADGILSCKGQPNGYIRTDAQYTNFVLRVSWRWEPAPGKAGNSGVLLRVQEPDKVWPKSIEAQLMAGNAGDFFSIGEFPMKGDAARSNGRHVAHVRGNERPQGEWNEYEIVVDGATIILNVNGEELNRAGECAAMAGRIALQSEGAAIQFRDVRVTPIK